MKKHITTILLVLIFFIGLSVLLYPTVADYVNSKSQSRAIAQYVEKLSHVDPNQYAEELAEARAYNEALLSNNSRFILTEDEVDAYHRYLGADGTAIGYVEIPVIGVDLPIYLGTEESVLQVGIGCMPGTSLPVGGMGTHTVLTGHRGLPSSRLLTDLDQVSVGDTFTVFVLNETMTYKVDQVLIVLPTEMEALAIDPEQEYCTLVTCTPYGINTHRMLVRGHRVDNAETGISAARVTADAIQVDTLIVTPIVAAPMLLILVLGVMFSGNKKRK